MSEGGREGGEKEWRGVAGRPPQSRERGGGMEFGTQEACTISVKVGLGKFVLLMQQQSG